MPKTPFPRSLYTYTKMELIVTFLQTFQYTLLLLINVYGKVKLNHSEAVFVLFPIEYLLKVPAILNVMDF